jgi:glucose/arabinose dehydrogenase
VSQRFTGSRACFFYSAVFEKQLPARYEIFAEGWLQGDKAWGRPVDVLVLKEGSLLVSGDRAGAIYRITYDRSPERPAGEK